MDGGSQALKIYHRWGHALASREYMISSISKKKQYVTGLQSEKDGRKIPVILFTIGGGQWLEPMIATGADAFGLDWTTPLDVARQTVAGRAALQGNLDPATLYGSSETIIKAT